MEPKSGKWKLFEYFIFKGRPQYVQIDTINMYILLGKRHGILMQCLGIYIEVEIFSHVSKLTLEDINAPLRYWVS